MKPEDYKKALEPHLGRRILVTGDHPWSGHSGKLVDAFMTLDSWCLEVELDSGMKCGVFDKSQMKWIDANEG